MINFLKNNKILSFSFIIYIGLFLVSPDKGFSALGNTAYFIKEMVTVLPLVFILTSLLEAWVPKEVIMNSFGENSGVKGIVYSFVLGSFSAGPIYAAFPVCKMLLKKGAGIMNIVIILSAWAVIKVPMLANEAKFLGVNFMAIRWIFTVIAIIFLSYVVSKTVKKSDLPSIEESSANNMPIHYNSDYCIGCGICVELEPSVFKMEAKKATIIKLDDYKKFSQSLLQVQNKCPGKAINIVN